MQSLIRQIQIIFNNLLKHTKLDALLFHNLFVSGENIFSLKHQFTLLKLCRHNFAQTH